MNFLDLVRERYSCRKFSIQKVEQDKIDKIIDSGILAPTAVNLQPFKIWEIRTPEAVEKVAQATPFTFGASVILAVGADSSLSYNRKYDGKNFAEVDASIVATHIMLAVQELGLGTTWVGHFDPVMLKSLFPQMNNYEIVALFPIGYPAEDAEPSDRHGVRKSKDDILEVI